jgi:hypothetical protein
MENKVKAVPITQKVKGGPRIVEGIIKELAGRRGVEAAKAEEAQD